MHGCYRKYGTLSIFLSSAVPLILQTHNRVIYETFKLYKYSLILITGFNEVFFVMLSQLMQCIKGSFNREVEVQTKR